ncbi:hypothetical protein [Catenulispora sp. GP43]|uniref:hypothetical protein n=1 Tax=Catenulispora sp. GP43 TaxID=3156263 RepID=UPI00351990F7
MPWKTRVLLYLGAEYITYCSYDAVQGVGHGLGVLVWALYMLVFGIVLYGPLTALAVVVDRFVLARTRSRWAALTMIALAPWPTWLFGADSETLLIQLPAQLLFGFTVSLLEFQHRTAVAAHRPNS